MQDDKKAHQITLQELGIIPKEPKRKEEVRKQYAFPCGGCVCSHCANNVETPDTCTGEMKEPCFTCDYCKLLSDDEVEEGLYFKMNEKVLLRTDSKTQMEILKEGINNGIETVNEARRKVKDASFRCISDQESQQQSVEECGS